MSRLMLDTNTVSYLVRGSLKGGPPETAEPPNYYISAISEAELIFGMRRRPEAVSLNALIARFLESIEILPFDSIAAERYGVLRADMQRRGKSLTSLDMLIAAHALSLGATLVTSDQAFRHVPGLAVEDWS